jgi:poly(3-hydroxybutyrate) depolymerase
MRILSATTMSTILFACASKSPGTSGDARAAGGGDAVVTNDVATIDSITPVLPTPTGVCPTIAPGDITFAPAGIPPRKVNLAFDPTKVGKQSALIVYWYATGSSTLEAAYSLGATETTIEQAGGIVATPYADPTAGEFEWFIVNMSPKLDDFLVADEVVACLAQANMIDSTHIHSMGMSAGALQTTAVSFMRSAYIASVATYSGGIPPGFTPAIEDPDNKFAALIFDGGSNDDVFGVDFEAASMLYQSTLTSAGHFAAICDHGMGHSIPLDAAPSVAMFFAANGFGAWPSPYASGLPASFPSYCAL